MKKKVEDPLCSHYKREGHVEAKCCKLHIELRAKRFENKKGNKNSIATIQHDLGLDLDDKTKITTMGMQGTSS